MRWPMRSKRDRTHKRLGVRQRAQLARLAKLPDGAIDTGDIPEIRNWSGAKRGVFYRPHRTTRVSQPS